MKKRSIFTLSKDAKLQLEKQRIAGKQAKQNTRLAEIEAYLSSAGSQRSVVE